METSTNSINKPFSNSSSKDRTIDTTFEESGWTMYFEDFFSNNINNNEEHSAPFSVDDGGTCMVSDAGSSAVKKPVGLSVECKSYNKSLSSKKRRTKGVVLIDADLEDTASSPASSPKVYDDLVSQFKKKTEQKDKMDMFEQGKGSASSQLVERSDTGFIGRESDDTELKKRGLCLVPLSMVANYLG